MTVTYSLDVASSSFLCMYRLLFRWKGSIWKSVWVELIVWVILYALLSVLYRYLLLRSQKETFEELCIFFDTYSNFIPITFMLGFYVSTVFTRWWDIFNNIGWIDTPCLLITQYIRGKGLRARMLRRSCIRYLVLCQAMVFRDVSASVRKRFPTLNHLVTAGLMTEKELIEFDSIESPHAKYWQPMHWMFSLLRIAKEEGLIHGDIIYCNLMDKISIFRGQVLSLTLYDWVPVPLVYTQVVHLAVRSYFAIALFGRQYLHPERDLAGFTKTIDLYVPIMSILQFIFFIGWMKVAEVLLNPLGEDDDDFECNWILDRNLQVGFSVVDDAFDKFPPLDKDSFWEDILPEPLYTAESAQRTINPQVGSCNDMATDDDQFMLRPRRRNVSHSSHWEADLDDAEYIQVQGLRRKDGSPRGSEDSLAFSQSLKLPGRRMSEMFKRIRGARKNSTQSCSNQARLNSDRRRNELQVENGNGGIRSNDSSTTSMERFGESFHNNTAPQLMNLQVENLRISTEDERKPQTAPPSLNPNVSWFVDEMLPVIQEEDHNRRVSDGDSTRSSERSIHKGTSATQSTEKLPTVKEIDWKEEEGTKIQREKQKKEEMKEEKREDVKEEKKEEKDRHKILTHKKGSGRKKSL